MSRIISGVNNWQAPLLKKKTSIASKVGANAYRKDRHINEPAPTALSSSAPPSAAKKPEKN